MSLYVFECPCGEKYAVRFEVTGGSTAKCQSCGRLLSIDWNSEAKADPPKWAADAATAVANSAPPRTKKA